MIDKYEILVPDGRVFRRCSSGPNSRIITSPILDLAAAGLSFALPRCFSSFINLLLSNRYAMFVLSLIFTRRESGLRNPVATGGAMSSTLREASNDTLQAKRCKLTTTTACRLLLNHWAISPVHPSHSKFCSKPRCAGRMVTRLPKRISTRWQDGWKNAHADREIAYHPARVLMQDFTGVPAVADLAAMLAAERPGGDTAKVNPPHRSTSAIDHR